jgi:hypothetical protein
MNPFHHLKEMPKALAALTGVFSVCGLVAIVLAILPGAGWTYESRPVTYVEFWRSGGCVLVVSFGVALILFAVGFFKAQGWVRYAVPLGLAAAMIYCIIRPDPTVRYEWAGSLFWGIPACWYFFRKRTVVDYFSRARGAEHDAPPNGGPAEPFGNSEAGSGPPSVS